MIILVFVSHKSHRRDSMEEQDFVPCDDCPNPSGCLTRCGIQEYISENTNIAEQRGETPEQLWGDTK